MTLDRKPVLIIAGLVAAGFVGFGVARFTAAPAQPAEEHADEHGEEGGQSPSLVRLTPQQAQAAGVMVVSVARGGGADVRLTGRVDAAPEAHAVVSAPISGTVQRLLVGPGARVAAGGGLVVLRSPDAATVVADLRAARAEAEAARAALAREDRLLKEGVVARQDWEAARATSAKASAHAAAAQARAAAVGSPGPSGEVVVRSPIAGVVTGIQASPGGFVGQGGAIADIADPLRVEVVFSAPAEVAAQLRQGGQLRIIGPDGAEASAVIVGIAPLAQDTTGAAVVRARPTGGKLTPGAAVSASVRATGGSVLAAPSEAVQTLGGRTVVFVLERDGFRPRPVTVGRTGAGYTEIVSGLSSGERIAGRGAFVLKAELSKSEAEHEH